MRVGHLFVTRPEWFDRNPNVVNTPVAATAAGADGGTVRASYTVPSGKKAYLDAAQLSVFRTVDGTPNQKVFVGLLYTPSASAGWILLIESSVSSYGPVGDQWIGQGGIMTAGHTLQWFSSVTFTDGTVTITALSKVTEFDA